NALLDPGHVPARAVLPERPAVARPVVRRNPRRLPAPVRDPQRIAHPRELLRVAHLGLPPEGAGVDDGLLSGPAVHVLQPLSGPRDEGAVAEALVRPEVEARDHGAGPDVSDA